ncbi:MAG: hypothetical protein IPN15_16955, partial [Saprospiraceae bacterium]|nr:hypothetical protein [Candidatus Vicinibacter affinis]
MSDAPMIIRRGTTLQWVIRVEQPVAVYVPISAIDNTAPARIHATAHGLYDGQRFCDRGRKSVDFAQCKILPAEGIRLLQVCLCHFDDTIDINEINAINLPAYTSGGAIRYNTPFNLTGYGIFMQARPSERSDTVLFEARQQLDGGIVIAVDGLSALVTVAADTMSLLSLRAQAFLMLRFVNPGGAVPFATQQRKLKFAGEITRVWHQAYLRRLSFL